MSEIIGYLSKIQIGENIYGIEDAIARGYINSITTNIESLSTLKANIASPIFTGIPETPYANNSITTQIANVQYVEDAILNAFKANDAMIFKGIVDNNHTLPTVDYEAGWTYKVAEAGNYIGYNCEVGDIFISIKDYNESSASNADWAVIQVNIDGAVTGPTNSINNHVVTFNGTSGKLIKDSGFTIEQSVPANGVFTDTLYTASTTEINSAIRNANIEAINGIIFNDGSTPQREQISFKAVNTWTAGTEASGVSVTTNKITSWSTGIFPSFNEISATTISNWSAGSTMTAITTSVKEVSSFSTGTLPVFTVNDDTLIFIPGVLPSLSTNNKEINEVATVGETPSLTLTTITASHVTDNGTLPSLTYEEQSVSKVDNFGTMPILATITTDVYSITDLGSTAELTFSTTEIPNISVTTVTVINAISASTIGV